MARREGGWLIFEQQLSETEEDSGRRPLEGPDGPTGRIITQHLEKHLLMLSSVSDKEQNCWLSRANEMEHSWGLLRNNQAETLLAPVRAPMGCHSPGFPPLLKPFKGGQQDCSQKDPIPNQHSFTLNNDARPLGILLLVQDRWCSPYCIFHTPNFHNISFDLYSKTPVPTEP